MSIVLVDTQEVNSGEIGRRIVRVIREPYPGRSRIGVPSSSTPTPKRDWIVAVSRTVAAVPFHGEDSLSGLNRFATAGIPALVSPIGITQPLSGRSMCSEEGAS